MNETDLESYTHPWYLRNKHLETIYPALLRKVKPRSCRRDRIITPDKDFIDIDIYNERYNKTAVLCHGLEGNSRKPYMMGMINILLNAGVNCIAWNYRGCSGIANRHSYSYHSGETDDLHGVIQHCTKEFPDTEVFLIGFSLGGNMVLKYLGERPTSQKVKKAVAISAPIDLLNSCRKISESSNRIYSNRFLRSLKKKIRQKARAFPDVINLNNFKKIKNLEDFDDHYTAPLHGFKNALDYYNRCSAINFLNNIRIPVLIINARNDPFLSEECFPDKVENKLISMDYPEYGGHLGFRLAVSPTTYYHELRTIEFLMG